MIYLLSELLIDIEQFKYVAYFEGWSVISNEALLLNYSTTLDD